ncbi:MAG: glutamine--fructose-6-phosphate transaminase (isomerizing) [Candidatus Eisenbacteria bacterium]|nr:glutamine--fructose-6-phosphate transaminase (isomerizing) [Candidatus Eisenbacteria bacterium]
MCGIVGCVAKDTDIVPALVEGLRRVEYRGYDSAGVTVVADGALSSRKVAGKIAALQDRLEKHPIQGALGIAHTRWATHGEPSEVNAHPQLDCTGKIAVVHNGIVENYRALRKTLESKGHVFKSETDTEVLAHLFEEHYEGDIAEAVRKALARVQGAYGIAVVHADEPEVLVGARNGSPLVVGVDAGRNYVASDVAALIRHTRDVVYLDDLEMVVATPEGFSMTTLENEMITRDVERVTWNIDMIEKNGYPHFMLKEIFEQDRTVMDAVRGRLIELAGDAILGGLREHRRALNTARRMIILACGTSWHAGLIGEYMIEDLARIPVEVEYASEFRYRNPVIEPGDIVLVISQSGETSDTLAAMNEAHRRGAIALGIVNVVGSTIARQSDGGVYTHAGPEIGVASTKAFTSQLMVLSALALMLGRARDISVAEGRHIVGAMRELPRQIREILDTNDSIRDIARRYAHHSNFLYLGRGYNFPVALEGALKLKEISYVHAEGYPAAEMKHGPIALIDENMPVVVVAPKDEFYKKILSNMEEVKSRGGSIIAIVSESEGEVERLADDVIEIPNTMRHLTPILTVVPLQLLAYHIAVERKCDVDQPRNLAKSVTVE